MYNVKIFRLLFLITACFFIINATLKAQGENDLLKTRSYKILFVGNSLTYSNDLPFLVEQAAAKDQIMVSTEILAKPNYALVDHWAEGTLQKKIKSKSFDFVIVQQGPSSQEEGRKLLLKSVKKLTKICEKNQSQLAVFMVWPSQQYYHTFDKVIKNHREVAKIYNAILCPVGEVWKTHFDKTQDFSYYGPDGFHPSQKGSESAAKIIVDSLFDEETAPIKNF